MWSPCHIFSKNQFNFYFPFYWILFFFNSIFQIKIILYLSQRIFDLFLDVLFIICYDWLGPPNPDNVPDDGKLKSEMMVKDNRRYYLDLKENSRGRFLRVSSAVCTNQQIHNLLTFIIFVNQNQKYGKFFFLIILLFYIPSMKVWIKKLSTLYSLVEQKGLRSKIILLIEEKEVHWTLNLKISSLIILFKNFSLLHFAFKFVLLYKLNNI